MRWLIYPPLIAVLVPLAAYGLTAAWVGRDQVWATWLGPVSRTAVDFETLEPGPEPHWFLACPPTHCGDLAHMAAPVFDRPVAQLEEAFRAMVDRRETMRPLPPLGPAEETPAGGRRQVSFEARTPVLRFPDTVTVRFYHLGENRSSLAIYSRSHYGYSDLGKNEERVRALLTALAAEVR